MAAKVCFSEAGVDLYHCQLLYAHARYRLGWLIGTICSFSLPFSSSSSSSHCLCIALSCRGGGCAVSFLNVNERLCVGNNHLPSLKVAAPVQSREVEDMNKLFNEI